VSDDRREWHVDKSVSITHLLTTAALVASGFWWFVKNENRFTQLEGVAGYNERRITQVEKAQVTQSEWISAKLDSIRKEQREDIVRLTDALNSGFLRLEEKLDQKADK
jgi:hypothetical protein